MYILINCKKIQWKPVIRRPFGVGKYFLITGIKYTVDMKTFFQMVLISGMFWYQVFLEPVSTVFFSD